MNIRTPHSPLDQLRETAIIPVGPRGQTFSAWVRVTPSCLWRDGEPVPTNSGSWEIDYRVSYLVVVIQE
jgi:hypothetical protein